MDEEQFEAVRQWGEGLQDDSREEVSAAGRAIVLLCAEVDRLERELWNVKTAVVVEPPGEETEPEIPADDRDEAVDTTLRERLRHAIGGLYTRPARR
ncbi:MAG TPA: hypothetical protein VH281_01345 [Gaiellaceae bacterium]